MCVCVVYVCLSECLLVVCVWLTEWHHLAEISSGDTVVCQSGSVEIVAQASTIGVRKGTILTPIQHALGQKLAEIAVYLTTP